MHKPNWILREISNEMGNVEQLPYEACLVVPPASFPHRSGFQVRPPCSAHRNSSTSQIAAYLDHRLWREEDHGLRREEASTTRARVLQRNLKKAEWGMPRERSLGGGVPWPGRSRCSRRNGRPRSGAPNHYDARVHVPSLVVVLSLHGRDWRWGLIATT